MSTRNSEVLADFVKFCEKNPDLRFWQALRVWADFNLILVSDTPNMADNLDVRDTFYWEGRRDEEFDYDE